MAYTKKRTTKKKYTKPTAKNSGQKALAIVRSMQQAINYKHNDYILPPDDASMYGLTYPLLEGVTKGPAEFQRIGDTIKLARVDIRFSVKIPSGVVNQSARSFRVVLLRGITENGLLPVMSEAASGPLGVFDDTGANPNLLHSRKSLNNMRDTKILIDKVYTLTPGSHTKREFHWNFPLHWKCQYTTQSTPTATNDLVQDGGLYFMWCDDTNGNEDLIIEFNARTTFSDL